MLNKTFKEEAEKIINKLKSATPRDTSIFNVDVYNELMNACEEYTRTRKGDVYEEAMYTIREQLYKISNELIVCTEVNLAGNSFTVYLKFRKIATVFQYCFEIKRWEFDEMIQQNRIEKFLREHVEIFKHSLIKYITGE